MQIEQRGGTQALGVLGQPMRRGLRALWGWVDRNLLELARELRLSFLPPLMVYLAAGVSGLTGIVGTFFVKDYLGLSAQFLAALGFWAGIPWALKMPLGHLVDLIWRYKSVLVFVGAGLIASSLLVMIGLLTDRAGMAAILPVEAWYVLGALLAPVGYVVQDVVADAMTVEAIPRLDADGQPFGEERLRLMHTTMQTLGRVAIVGGGVLVAVLNLYLFSGVEGMGEPDKMRVYTQIYRMALLIPVVSVLGVLLAGVLRVRELGRLRRLGLSLAAARTQLAGQTQSPAPNWWILGGSLVFVVFTLAVGLNDIPHSQEIVFVGSLGIVLFLMARLLQVLEPRARRVLVGTAIIIFCYRATPSPGAGSTWWMIDVLGFDQRFLSLLSLIGSSLALLGMFLFRRFMAERSITHVVVLLTLVGTFLSLPILGMYYGLHEWTAALTGGVVDARFIAVVDTALESPLGQIAMIPMLAWIANSAPASLKATFFAVMASFTNLALSLSQLGTKYLNQIYTVSREVRDPLTKAVSVPADYGELGWLLGTVTLIGLLLPLGAILLARSLRLQSA